MDSFFALLMVVLYFAVLIFLISLLSRFVNAIERIANKIESSSKI